MSIKRALISVSDKTGLVPFVQGLHEMGIEILSTGGTARELRSANIPVIEVSDYTGFPEMLSGRVKTLHPKIHGGLLALRDDAEHMKALADHGIGLIDLVVVNLYPFEQVIKDPKISLEHAIENIDIGGPSMLRSAAKNYRSVTVICNPERYDAVLTEMKNNNGAVSAATRFTLAQEVYARTATYDAAISAFLLKRIPEAKVAETSLPEKVSFSFEKVQDLRYGENPHQKAAFYKDQGPLNGLANLKQLHGKELSFNNIMDLNAAVDFIKEFSQPAAVIIKHNNPTGLAENAKLALAYKQALAVDTISAFGGIIGLNRPVDEATAKLIAKSGFMECVIAPSFSKTALVLLTQKKNVRLIEFDFKALKSGGYDLKKVYGGLLLQDKDELNIASKDLKIASKKKPTKAQIEAMLFGWKVVRGVKSNAIILVKGKRVVGIGCGQTSRVESVNIAIRKAGKDAKGSIMVSDAFLPKTDNVELAHKAGIKAIIQTGGSIADAEVIQAADKYKMVMVLTGARHFKH
ncbi:MAG: bifunctional phosphoribosylaminoimidazolecarboxamide formyltransferase/IMP cyclohydrolase [Candidatus Omnitrophica bacterium]|nr:bifunctional phosphoribosylaminoimidazolecarboxamide formyltransferase/IMP cyclohydrolase [Candidatus Omnitrophota bacterium]